MQEIGGYIELDTYKLPMLHSNAIALNCGRNCLVYLIETRKIRNIWLPYFLCDSVKNICKKQNINIKYYHIGPDFQPESIKINKHEWIYLVNFYGQLTSGVQKKMVKKYQNVIIDNAQAYFEKPLSHVDTIYTCRKFIGVPDGAFLYTDAPMVRELPLDRSFERMHYLLGRFEGSATDYYNESVSNNKLFSTEPIKRMSKLTENLLHGVDYRNIEQTRTKNFDFLDNKLKNKNKLTLHPVKGAFMYPFLIDNAPKIRDQLLKKEIYIPILWPNILKDVPEDWFEWRLAQHILPLPCDQRYGIHEMELICELLSCT